jgi:hypothetical protein
MAKTGGSKSDEIREEVKEILQQEKAKKVDRRNKIFLEVGTYLCLAFGVVLSQAVVMHDDLSATLKKLELGQMGGSLIIAGVLYNRLESKGELRGKSKNIFRVFRNAVYHGFV